MAKQVASALVSMDVKQRPHLVRFHSKTDSGLAVSTMF